MIDLKGLTHSLTETADLMVSMLVLVDSLPGCDVWLLHPRNLILALRQQPIRDLTIYTGPSGLSQWLALPQWVKLMVYPDNYYAKDRVAPVVQELIWQGMNKGEASKLVKAPPKTYGNGKLYKLNDANWAASEWPNEYTYTPPPFSLPLQLIPNSIPVALDFETGGGWKFKTQISGLAVGIGGSTWWITDEEQAKNTWEQSIQEGRPIYHGGNYDLAVAKSRGWALPVEYDDTLLMAFSGGEKTDDNERTLGLKVLANKYLHRSMRELRDFIGDTEFKRSGTLKADPLILAQYAQEDIRATLDLLPILRERMHRPTYELEMDIAPIVLGMDEVGFNADTKVLSNLAAWAERGMEAIEAWLQYNCSWAGNIGSVPQVQALLFDRLGLQSSLGRSTSKEALEELHWHPVAKRIRAWRRLESLKQEADTLLAQYIIDGRMHTTFFQYGGSTGRFSSGDPINLQNKRITLRKAFVADDDKSEWVYAADYGQIELRIPAYLANDKAMLQAIKEGRSLHKDLHTQLRELGINIEYIDVKRFDFGVFYGAEIEKIADILHCDLVMAGEIMDGLMSAWPEAMAWRKKVLQETYDNGNYNCSMRGRPYYYPGLDSPDFNIRSHTERAAVNRIIQGTAADVMKLAIKGIPELHKKYGGKLRLTVHDEVVGTIPKENAEAFVRDLRMVMLEAEPLIPLAVEIGLGKSWKEAKP